MQQLKSDKMGTTPMLKLIISMSIPAMFSMLVQSLYNVVDSIFVGKIGPDSFAAVSFAYPIQMFMIAVAVGTGVGINSLISRKLGEQNRQEADSTSTHGIILALASWLLFLFIGIFGSRAFMQSCTTNPNIINLGCEYIEVVTICSIGLFMEITISKTLQATGNMINPMIAQLIGAITNIVLDPILIFGFDMGVKGAAIATVIGQCFSMIYDLIIIFTKSHDIHISFKNFKLDPKIIKQIYIVGFPSIIMQSIAALLTTLLNNLLNTFSVSAVSVLGVYYKMQSFVFMPIFGLTHGVMPIMGYNYGAKNKKRLMSALKISVAIAIIIMSLGTALFMILPKQILLIFNATPEMLEIGVRALRTICLCFIPAALGIMFSTLFQAVGMGIKSLFISALRQLIVILPAAYLFAQIGLNYVWFAFPLAEFIALIVSIFIIKSLYKNHIRDL
ncbi:MAG: MATE family efflux transporter [Oscillospiraceae bacterium]